MIEYVLAKYTVDFSVAQLPNFGNIFPMIFAPQNTHRMNNRKHSNRKNSLNKTDLISKYKSMFGTDNVVIIAMPEIYN